MKILYTYWFTTSTGLVGAVVCEDVTTGEKKAYIGIASGNDERLDADLIAQRGSPVPIRWFVDMLNHLAPSGKQSGKYNHPGPVG